MTVTEPAEVESPEEDSTVEIEVVGYPEIAGLDEQRRAFVLGLLSVDPTVDIRIILKACGLSEAYLKDGTVPPEENPSSGRRFKVVKE